MVFDMGILVFGGGSRIMLPDEKYFDSHRKTRIFLRSAGKMTIEPIVPMKASTKCWKQPILGFLLTFPIRNPSMDAGQRPTEKRIFYAGSTLGPNRMVRLAQGRRTGAAEAISDGSTGQHDLGGPEMAKSFSVKMYQPSDDFTDLKILI